jgi:hypothetical protein
MKLSRSLLPYPVTRIVVWFVKFDLGALGIYFSPLFFLSSAVKKHVFEYFSEDGGFRVEDQGLSFLYGGNSERLQGLLGRRRPRGTAFIATTPYK